MGETKTKEFPVAVSGSDIENDGGSIAAFDLPHGCIVPGSRLNGAAQIMPTRIIRFSVHEGMQACLTEVVNLKLAKDEVFGIEEKNQFIQPVDKQGDRVMAFHAHLSPDLGAHLLRGYQQALHALGYMRKKLAQGGSRGMQTNIGCMFEHFIGFRRKFRHHVLFRSSGLAAMARIIDNASRIILPVLSFPVKFYLC